MATDADQKRDVGQLYVVAKAILSPVFRFSMNMVIEGLENIPAEGPAIIAPNHVSVLDSFVVPAALPRRITYVGKAEYMDDWKTKYLFPALGMIPIDRGGGSAAQRALDAAARVLDRGELFGIYPEGTRSRDQKLHKGHTGPARLALRCRCPIVPTGIQGTLEVQPPEAKVPKLFRTVRIRFGPPVDVTRYLDRADERPVLRQITDEVMFEIRHLSGQEYVDTYATKQAETLPAETGRLAVGDRPVGGAGTEGANGAGGHPGAEGDAGAEAPRRSSASVLRSGT
jgi:1-acyl-sn-glycerol-3-phosphate acyltransferase